MFSTMLEKVELSKLEITGVLLRVTVLEWSFLSDSGKNMELFEMIMQS